MTVERMSLEFITTSLFPSPVFPPLSWVSLRLSLPSIPDYHLNHALRDSIPSSPRPFPWIIRSPHHPKSTLPNIFWYWAFEFFILSGLILRFLTVPPFLEFPKEYFYTGPSSHTNILSPYEYQLLSWVRLRLQSDSHNFPVFLQSSFLLLSSTSPNPAPCANSTCSL